MEKIWYDPHEKSPRVDRILSQMSNLQTFELTQRVKAILQDKKKISPIPDIWRLRKQKNQSFFPEIAIQLKIELFEPEDRNFEVDESLEEIVNQMENLESLFIDIKSNWAGAGFRDIYIPALRGLKSCTKLKVRMSLWKNRLSQNSNEKISKIFALASKERSNQKLY